AFAPAVAATSALGQQPAPAEIRGRVTTSNGVPLPGAEVTISGDSLGATTDSGGRFVLRNVAPGEWVIRVRRIGFRAQDLSARLAPGERKEVTVALTPGAYRLPEVEVTARFAKPIEYAWTTKYDDFFRRQRVGLGYYIGRKDIERRPATQTAELLFGVPGLQVKLGAPGLTPNAIRTTRCANLSVWIDGWEVQGEKVGRRMYGDPTTPAEVTGVKLERIRPLEIEMIEVYTSPARGQAEFVGSSCGAIMIWTR
ncbi:MAG TPA: TonB-dependent receptor, partial [Gemmatimonadales bacterium]|nr:TonB-dependent receptor [Gemmatimonadales bacterium]